MGAWTTSRLPGVLGRLGSGQAQPKNKECAEGGDSSREEPSTDLKGSSLTVSTADPRPCQATKGPCFFCKDPSVSESAGEGEPAQDKSGEKRTQPPPARLQPPKAFASKTGVSCRSCNVDDCGWTVERRLLIPSWDSH